MGQSEKRVSRWIQDPQLTKENSYVAICDPDTKDTIPEGTASQADWRETTVESVSSYQCQVDEAADSLGMQATLDWLYDNQESHTEYAQVMG